MKLVGLLEPTSLISTRYLLTEPLRELLPFKFQKFGVMTKLLPTPQMEQTACGNSSAASPLAPKSWRNFFPHSRDEEVEGGRREGVKRESKIRRFFFPPEKSLPRTKRGFFAIDFHFTKRNHSGKTTGRYQRFRKKNPRAVVILLRSYVRAQVLVCVETDMEMERCQREF